MQQPLFHLPEPDSAVRDGDNAAAQVAAPRLRRINRDQLLLRTIDVEELIGEDHAARAIWEFTGRLDLSAFTKGMKAVEGRAGQPSLDPRLLMAVWLYAYSRGIGSAREVSRQCEQEPGLQWLCGMEPINHHSLSDFRVAQYAALESLMTQVLGVLSAEGLIKLERVTQDGTRIRALASGSTFRREETLQEHLKLAEEQVQAMGDPRQESGLNARCAQARKRAGRERVERLEAALSQLKQLSEHRSKSSQHEARASMTDAEARVMKRAGGGFEPAYNVQLSTDAEAGMVVHVAVTQSGTDAAHLAPALEAIEKTFGKMPDQVLADGGYITNENIVELDGRTELIGPLQTTNPAREEGSRKRRGIDEDFRNEKFVHEADINCYRCPAGKLLMYYKVESRRGDAVKVYRANQKDCQACAYKQKCCPQTATRQIHQVVPGPAVEAFAARMQRPEMQQIYRKRSQLAEFPNAWIKEKFRLRQFHVRTLKKVTMESIWAALTYNIQQWARLRWRPAHIVSV
jgi:transposase